MDDDLYPNDSSYFIPKEPVEQNIARKKEKAKVLEGLQVLKDIIQRYEERIAFYENVNSIPDELRTEPDKFMHVHTTHMLVAEALKAEKEFIEGLLDEHAKNR